MKYDNDMLTMTKNQESLDQEFQKYKEKKQDEIQEHLDKIQDLQEENQELSEHREPPFFTEGLSDDFDKAESPNLSVNLSVIEMAQSG